MYRVSNRRRCFELGLQWKRSVHQNHYDSLGLTPKATQSDIKKAYYNMSMKFHPDKPEGSETKFREITAAYEVLGNLKLRRLYDQGIFRDVRGVAYEVDREEDIPHDIRMKPKSSTPATGRTNVYDFDEWSRMHYSKTVQKDFKKRERMSKNLQARRNQLKKEDDSWYMAVALVTILLMIPYFFLGGDPDTPSRKKPPDGGGR